MDNPIIFISNGKEVRTFLSPAVTLLDFIRKELNLTGTKEGCREGDCGACTVLVGGIENGGLFYRAVNSCLVPLGMVHGKHLVTIEGVNQKALSPFQEALINEGAIQCGFCTPGIIMSMTGYLLSDRYLSLEGAIDAIGGNICRCTGYEAIKRAVYSFMMESEISLEAGRKRMESLIEKGFLPFSFMNIEQMLKEIAPLKTLSSNGSPEVLFAGGTDLMLKMRDRPPDIHLHFLTEEKEEKIIIEKGFFVLDAGLSVTEMMNSELLKSSFPEFGSYLRLFGSEQIRNMATLGGNIVNASPAADLVNIFLALDATLVLKNKNENREVTLKDFYLGYKQFDKKGSERLSKLRFLLPEGNYFFNYEKISRRQHLDIASVNSSIYMEAEDGFIRKIHISAGGVAPFPLYLKETAQFFKDRQITYENIRDGALIAQSEISPISDIRGSEEYKRLLLRQLLLAHFFKFFPELTISAEILFA
ncbi:MAG TPA: FAD binding domain-containing protein [Ignavibacteriales bacterium]|nr:FAD binding domain-containing protein [Ignavibacteriales bacterium]